jgi:hypothetical protein
MQQEFGQSIITFSKSTTFLLLLLYFLLTLPSRLPLKLRIQKLLWAQSLTQKIGTTVAKTKITNHLAGE